jgi:hypothetical protein
MVLYADFKALDHSTNWVEFLFFFNFFVVFSAHRVQKSKMRETIKLESH